MNLNSLSNATAIARINHFYKLTSYVTQRSLKSNASNNTAMGAVFLEKTLEDPVVVVPKKNKVDMIGPPSPVSNLRPVVRQRLLNETPLQQRLRELQDETQAWNEKFWFEHNSEFKTERDAYTKSRLKDTKERTTLTADEMSEFYKDFLDRHWNTHVRYNFEWYKRNFAILVLALRVHLEWH